MQWLDEIRIAARRSNRPHFADFAEKALFQIGAKVQSRELARLTEKCSLLEQKLTAKIDTTVGEVSAKIVELVFTKIEARLASAVEQRLQAAVRAVEGRFENQRTFEDVLLKRIGALSKNVDGLEARLRELNA